MKTCWRLKYVVVLPERKRNGGAAVGAQNHGNLCRTQTARLSLCHTNEKVATCVSLYHLCFIQRPLPRPQQQQQH